MKGPVSLVFRAHQEKENSFRFYDLVRSDFDTIVVCTSLPSLNRINAWLQARKSVPGSTFPFFELSRESPRTSTTGQYWLVEQMSIRTRYKPDNASGASLQRMIEIGEFSGRIDVIPQRAALHGAA
jgi:hypothetical protein